METITGWLLDLYEHPKDDAVLWMLGDDGKRHRLCQPFPVTFYAAGPSPRLRAFWQWLRSQPFPLELGRQERRDLFRKEPVTVLAATVEQPFTQPRLFRRAARKFPDLTFYDADIPLPLRHAATYDTFPLARVGVTVNSDGIVQNIETTDSPWELDHDLPPLRILRIQPNCDPSRRPPTQLILHDHKRSYRYSLDSPRSLLVCLQSHLIKYDPDLILTMWGDSWLIPYLLELSRQHNIPLSLSREPGWGVASRPERTFFAYGQVIYRGPKMMLYGRWHIDIVHAVMFADYGMDGVLEMSRVTSLPVQTAARVSPGTGISAMQIRTALRWGVLVPWHKQQVERPKSAAMLLHADKGGMVYQPTIGLHHDVVEVDFTSMYPAIMVNQNISPETIGEYDPDALPVPELGLKIDRERPGLVPETLRPLLEKRVILKTCLLELDRRDCRYAPYKARAAAHKWLLVVCFGYLGYKNARFGRIEAHEAVTAYGREMLLRAKEAAEDLGYTLLHMYVDGLWVKKAGIKTVKDVQPLLDEIVSRTGLPISLDGIYHWVAFLPSRMDARVPVANRYFGIFQDGSLKMRGIAARRHDTPKFIKELQMDLLRLMAQEHSGDLTQCLPQAVSLLQAKLADLRQGRIPLDGLLVTQALSRELEEYRQPSPVARAVAQLNYEGKSIRPGQYVRFAYVRGKPGVHAWDSSVELEPAAVDVKRYTKLMLRAAHMVLQPLGVDEPTLRLWVIGNASYAAPPGILQPLAVLFPPTTTPLQFAEVGMARACTECN